MPRKALSSIAGLPLVEHVRRRAVEAGVGPVVVATSDPEIAQVVRAYGGDVVVTGDHPNGTRRVAAAARGRACGIVVNVQGDQPLLDPAHVRRVVAAVERSGTIATLCAPWPADIPIASPDHVKVWRDPDGFARDFSRAPRDGTGWLHVGLYGFPRRLLDRVTSCPVGERARVERLEQLTWLVNGHPILVEEVAHSLQPVDTPEQLARARAMLGD